MNRLVKYEIKKIDNKERLRIELFIAENEEVYNQGFHDVVDFYYCNIDKDLTTEENIIECLKNNWEFNKGDNLIILD